jgi:hypothetical protein
LYTTETDVKTAFGYVWEYDKNFPDLEGELWVDLSTKIPNTPAYKISNMGRIKNVRGFLINAHDNACGYLVTGIGNKKQQFIHRLVAIAFLDNLDNKPIVNHKDGDKKNNKLSNLEWVTSQENCQHAHALKLHSAGNTLRVTNVITKEVRTFVSMAEASRQLKSGTSTVHKYTKNGQIYENMKFEKV